MKKEIRNNARMYEVRFESSLSVLMVDLSLLILFKFPMLEDLTFH